MDALEIRTSQQGDRVELEVKSPRSESFSGIGFHVSASAKLIVSVPARADVQARSGDGSISVERVNGRPVPNLQALREAFASVTTGYHVIEFLSGQVASRIVIDAAESDAASERLRRAYGVERLDSEEKVTALPAARQDAYVLEDQVGHLLRRAHQRATAIFMGNLGERFDLTPTQYAALVKLRDEGEASQNRLGRLIAIDPATIQGVIRRLEERRLIERAADEGDKRRTKLRVTPAGEALVDAATAYGAEVNLYGLQGLAREPMLIPEVDFAGLARSVGAEGVVVRSVDDLSALSEWAARPASERPFLLLDCRISGTVIAPYQQEIIRVNS